MKKNTSRRDFLADGAREQDEILIKRLGNPKLDAVFPAFPDFKPLGIIPA